MQVIEIDGLALVPQTAAHAGEMFVVLSDPAIYEHENEPPASIEALRYRFAMLESRQSADGQEQWLNWVIRLPTLKLIGYVQASVDATGSASIAYVLSSAYWGRGLASQAVQAMRGALAGHYQVRRVSAILKRHNGRSLRLLQRLGFALAPSGQASEHQLEPDELLMLRHIDIV